MDSNISDCRKMGAVRYPLTTHLNEFENNKEAKLAPAEFMRHLLFGTIKIVQTGISSLGKSSLAERLNGDLQRLGITTQVVDDLIQERLLEEGFLHGAVINCISEYTSDTQVIKRIDKALSVGDFNAVSVEVNRIVPSPFCFEILAVCEQITGVLTNLLPATLAFRYAPAAIERYDALKELLIAEALTRAGPVFIDTPGCVCGMPVDLLSLMYNNAIIVSVIAEETDMPRVMEAVKEKPINTQGLTMGAVLKARNELYKDHIQHVTFTSTELFRIDCWDTFCAEIYHRYFNMQMN